eukprot:jgi/Orpsp1_1/1174779/evm.model.c7180000051389.1
MKILSYENRNITNPPNDILFNNPEFIFLQPVTLFLEQFLEEPKTSKYDYIITDKNNIEYFKCMKITKHKTVIYDINEKPLANIQIKTLPLQINIYEGDGDEKVLATYATKGSTVAEKCEFHYYNKATEKNECLDMNCDKFYCSCGIFYGTEKEGAPMICKFKEIMDSNSFMTYLNKKYVIDISAKVDNIVIIAIAIYFAEMNFHTRKNRKNYSDLT